MKFLRYLNKPLFFPVVFLLLHIITYGVFFGIANYHTSVAWHSYERSSPLNLLWFYDTWWPNWCGAWIILGILRRKVGIIIGCFYLFAMFGELYWMGWDYGEFFGGASLQKAQYAFAVSKLTYRSMEQTMLHLSVFVAGTHFLILYLLLGPWRKRVNNR